MSAQVQCLGDFHGCRPSESIKESKATSTTTTTRPKRNQKPVDYNAVENKYTGKMRQPQAEEEDTNPAANPEDDDVEILNVLPRYNAIIP